MQHAPQRMRDDEDKRRMTERSDTLFPAPFVRLDARKVTQIFDNTRVEYHWFTAVDYCRCIPWEMCAYTSEPISYFRLLLSVKMIHTSTLNLALCFVFTCSQYTDYVNFVGNYRANAKKCHICRISRLNIHADNVNIYIDDVRELVSSLPPGVSPSGLSTRWDGSPCTTRLFSPCSPSACPCIFYTASRTPRRHAL